MTLTYRSYGHNVNLAHQLGFTDERGTDGLRMIHESEPVRFVWDDEEGLAFTLYRFRESKVDGVRFGPFVWKLSGSNIPLDEFTALVRTFLHG